VGNQPPLAHLKSEGFDSRQRCRKQLWNWVSFWGADPSRRFAALYPIFASGFGDNPPVLPQ